MGKKLKDLKEVMGFKQITYSDSTDPNRKITIIINYGSGTNRDSKSNELLKALGNGLPDFSNPDAEEDVKEYRTQKTIVKEALKGGIKISDVGEVPDEKKIPIKLQKFLKYNNKNCNN